MKFKLKNLGTTRQNMPSAFAQPETSGKSITEYPEINLNSRQIPGLKEYAENGLKCNLQFVGEVSGFRSADGYDISSGRLGKDDIYVTIKLLKGDVEEIEKPKTIRQAQLESREESHEEE